MCNIALLNVYSLDSGETSFFQFFFLFTEQFAYYLNTSCVQLHNHNIWFLIFTQSEKQDNCTGIFLYSQHTDKSIHILFSNINRRQNIQTNRQQNMQHPEHKVSDDYPGWTDFFFFSSRLGCFRTRVHRYSLVDSTRLDYTLGSPRTTTDTPCCTSKSLTLLYCYY